MLQKITWMRYLILGISTSLALVSSCGRTESDCLVQADFMYVNKTSHIIETPLGTIDPNAQLSKHQEGLGPCEVSEDNYVPPFLGETTIIFDDSLCLTYKSEKAGVGEGPVGIDNYKSSKVGKLHYKFTYEFTEEDYNKAVKCN